MKRIFLFLFSLAVLCALYACTPSEEDVHPKRRSSRTDNLKRYVPKAQELRAQALARSKPLVNSPLLPPGALEERLPSAPDARLSAYIVAQKTALEDTVREAGARRAGEKTSVLLTRFRDEAVSAAKSASNPRELAERFNELKTRYFAELSDLAREEETLTWSRPDERQSQLSRQRLKETAQAVLNDVTRDYGAVCAQRTVPVLQKSADDYWLVLSSGQTPEDLEKELLRVGEEADAAFNRVVKSFGDPAAVFSPEDAAALTSRARAAYEEMENQFEKLYGAEALSQTRAAFERYLNGLTETLAKPGRLSRKRESLERLEAAYREEMTALQVRLNGEIERRNFTRRLQMGEHMD